jgi:hypothetical protein
MKKQQSRRRLDPAGGPITDLATRQFATAAELQRDNALAEAEAHRKAAALADLQEIGKLINDPTIRPDRISGLILRRMTHLLEELQEPITGDTRARFDHEMKGLRELHNVFIDGLMLRQRGDVLDIDGPKFQIAFDFIMKWLRTTLQQVGIDPSQRQSVFMELRDQLALNTEALRRDLANADRIDGENAGPSANGLWPSVPEAPRVNRGG